MFIDLRKWSTDVARQAAPIAGHHTVIQEDRTMRRSGITVAAVAVAAASLLAVAAAAQAASVAAPRAPTAGLTKYSDTYKVQQPYDLPVSARFSVTAGVYNTWVLKGDKPLSPGSGTGPRTEMRWNTNWTRVEHMWDGDVLVDPGTENTCIMQIKSNTNGEPIYVVVKGGNLYHGSGNLVAHNVVGHWFHLTTDFNPTTGTGHIWVNGVLVFTRHVTNPLSVQYYFKNGVYNLAGAKSSTHFRNITFWHG
jgi:hypothetical protein